MFARYKSIAKDWLEIIPRGLPWLPGAVLTLGGCSDGTHLSFLDPQGPIATAQRWHFYEALAVLVTFVALPIFVLTPWFAWRYRYRANKPYTPKWSFSRLLEIMSWTGPVLIVAMLSIIVWRDTHKLDPYKPLASNKPVLPVQVIGYDWKWLFIYPDQGIASIGVMAFPAARPVALQLTSATVMQSFFIPSLSGQIYAMGGMVTRLHLEAAKPGRFLGENTMYNGNGFHQQQFTAIAMTPNAFDEWVRKVRTAGIALDTRTLNAISQRSTRTQLVAALPHAKSPDGNVYLTDVTARLFPTVVEATRNGTPVAFAAPPSSAKATALSQPAEPTVAEPQ